MRLELNRVKDDGVTTLGTFNVDGEFECFAIEDTTREVKVVGETCIPTGEYEIKLRDAGGMTKKYASRYDFHEGMLWLQDVPGFKWVYIHTGNKASHSEGCILVNDMCDSTTGDITGGKSRTAYARLYKKILVAIGNGEDITISIR